MAQSQPNDYKGTIDMVTKRDWLVEQKLASPGRGRFSVIAKEAIRRAEASGMVFDEAPKKTTSAQPAKKTATVQATPISKGKKQPVRTEVQMYGKDENGVTIAFGDCANGHSVRMCDCENGPVLPKWVGGGIGLLEKPA